MTRFIATCMLAGLLGMGISPSAPAATVVFPLVFEFSGAQEPQGVKPWGTATFEDMEGMVLLTMANTNLVNDEFVAGWYFNLDPALDPTELVFLQTSKTGSLTDPSISTSVDAFQADGDGKYDILFEFDTSSPGGTSENRFGAGESLTYKISGILGLTADSFDYLSAPAGGSGPFPTAAHVQGIGEGAEGSGWVTTPEPSSAFLAIFGLVGVLGFVWRQRDQG